MDIKTAIESRHSVRQYTEEPISGETRALLEQEVATCNSRGNLHMKLVWDEPEAFDSAMAHYGKFSGVRNYLVIAGAPASDLEERGGYWGEHVALWAQELGLSTCWVAMTFKRRYVRAHLEKGDQMVLVVALGHGATRGVVHKSKAVSDVSNATAPSPEWFSHGVECALLAPTAMNQQSFFITLTGGTDASGLPTVRLENKGGAYSKVDLGIVRYHFEVGAGEGNFSWVK